MEFSKHTVGQERFIVFHGGVHVRLTADQYRRRKHLLTEVMRDGDAYVGFAVRDITFKCGETFEIEGVLPKSYYGLVLDPPQRTTPKPPAKTMPPAMAKAPAKAPKAKRKAKK